MVHGPPCRPDGQKYTPHVTLTWPKDPPISKAQEYLAGHNLFRSDPFEVRISHPYLGLPGSENSIYHGERSYALTAPQLEAPACKAAGR